jgi:hypothetical protein
MPPFIDALITGVLLVGFFVMLRVFLYHAGQ